MLTKTNNRSFLLPKRNVYLHFSLDMSWPWTLALLTFAVSSMTSLMHVCVLVWNDVDMRQWKWFTKSKIGGNTFCVVDIDWIKVALELQMIWQQLYFTLKILNIWGVHLVLQIIARSCIVKVYETGTTPCFPSEQRNFPADIAVSRVRVSPEVHLLLNSPIHCSNFDWALKKDKMS